MKRLLLACVLAVCGASESRSEKLIISLSTHRVLITSNFTGVELTLFGSIEADAGTVSRSSAQTIVVTITGPKETVVTWRKQRFLGIWVNTASRTFVGVPNYLAVLTNRPVETIASPDALRRFQLGVRSFLLPQLIGSDVADVSPDDLFRQGFIRLKLENGLYLERPNAVTFLTPTLFRTGIPLPSNVPVGEYVVDVKLFADGALIAREESAFEIVKAG
ncbi:MAG: hypothetical protein QOD74_2564, partial [Variibacter sp.]|nr:hypothetical protein [Variibacter sp.]